MTRSDLAAWLTDTYSASGESLFTRYPSFQVFRHHGNGKWFAVIMDIPRQNLGLTGETDISIVNLKCDTRMIGSFVNISASVHWLTSKQNVVCDYRDADVVRGGTGVWVWCPFRIDHGQYVED